VGQIAQGGVVGEVTVSNIPAWPVGTFVLSNAGWREHCILSEADAQVVEQRDGVPLSSYLDALGMPGMTAYAGLFRVAEFVPGDIVFVSAAAGALGSLVGQFAKTKGASRVIGRALRRRSGTSSTSSASTPRSTTTTGWLQGSRPPLQTGSTSTSTRSVANTYRPRSTR
jgi:NADPH:quinone reductase-like Zn-dependent oxidoreductase